MNICIVTANFGSGHNKAARVLKKELENRENSVEIINTFDVKENKRSFINRYYEPFIKRFKYIYNIHYFFSYYIKNYSNIINAPIIFSNSEKFEKYIIEKNPDIIISLFPVTSKILSRLKKKYDFKLITCLTDALVSYEWINKNTDLYFVSSKKLKKKMEKRVYKNSGVIVTGIPSVYNPIEKTNYNDKIEKIVILLDVLDIVNLKKEDVIKLSNSELKEILIICGKNKEAYDNLKDLDGYKNIKVIGYTDKMQEFLIKYDAIVTKPGGLIVAEALKTGNVVLSINSNFGQEKYNHNFLKEEKIGFEVPSMKDLVKKIEYINNNDLYKERIKHIKELKSTYEDLTQYI